MVNKLSLAGRVAVVTGGAQGMGEAHCRLLAERGAIVIVADLKDSGAALTEELVANGAEAMFINLNVCDEDNWHALVATAMAKYGRIDALVNNAGVAQIRSIEDSTVEDLDFLMGVNLRGTFLGCRSILPAMKAAGSGSIVNIGSSSAMKVVFANLSLYSASKGAVKAFSKSAALEFVKYNIRVNTVHPGQIATPLNAAMRTDPSRLTEMLGTTMFARFGESPEVAEAVAFLCSDASSYMTGADICVDGGWTAS